MKKAIILLVLAVLATGVLSACTKNNTTNTTVTPTTAVTVTSPYHVCGGEMTLGQYKGLEYSMKKVVVTDEEIETQITKLLTAKPNYKKNETPDHTDVRDGDVVNIDYAGKVGGVAFQGGTDTDSFLKIGSNSFIPGFESSLIGKQIGTTVDINVTFPNPYTPNTSLSGADAVFTVTLNYFGKEKEGIDDEYVKRYFSAYATSVDSLKQYFRDAITDDKKADLEEEMWDYLITTVIDNSTYTKILPEDVDFYYNLSMSQFHQYAQMYGLTDEQLYNKYYDATELDYNGFLQKCREQAEQSVKEYMALQAIVKAENITFTPEEYAKTAEEYRVGAGLESIEVLESSYGKEYIEYCLLNDKVLDLIRETAVIKEVE